MVTNMVYSLVLVLYKLLIPSYCVEKTDCKDARLSSHLDPLDKPDGKENDPNPLPDHNHRYGTMYCK